MKPLFALLLLGGIPLAAQEVNFESKSPSAALVELYTSEGCSSCPPAEDWLNKLRTAPGLWKDLFPISFHVNYWDNLGWPDRFATSAYTQRQRDYAARFESASVYTPEFIVDGREWRRGQPLAGGTKSGELKLHYHAKDKTLSADYAPAPGESPHALTLNAALLGMGLVTDVRRGENAGSKLTHEFIALGFGSAPLKPGADGKLQNAPLALRPSTDDPATALVAWVSRDNGSIAQIAGGWLNASPP
jgi:hypothetical protein